MLIASFKIVKKFRSDKVDRDNFECGKLQESQTDIKWLTKSLSRDRHWDQMMQFYHVLISS